MACTRGFATKTIVLSPAELGLTPCGTTKQFSFFNSSSKELVQSTWQLCLTRQFFRSARFDFSFVVVRLHPMCLLSSTSAAGRTAGCAVVPKWMTWKSENYTLIIIIYAHRFERQQPKAASVRFIPYLYGTAGTKRCRNWKNSKQWKYQRRRVK